MNVVAWIHATVVSSISIFSLLYYPDLTEDLVNGETVKFQIIIISKLLNLSIFNQIIQACNDCF